MTKDLYRPQKNKKLRPSKKIQSDKRLNLDELNSRISSRKFKIVKRSQDPNYCTILFNACGHEKDVIITGIKKEPICYTCKDEELSEKALTHNFRLLTKLTVGNGKSKYENRLFVCNLCGYFKIMHPTTVKSSENIRCRSCLLREYENLPNSSNWKFLGTSYSRSTLLNLECKHCGVESKHQLSNVRRYSPVCKSCGKAESGKSYVYAFKIENEHGCFVKLGKSNNPYLRHIGFSPSGKNVYKFLGAKHFDSESEAMVYEREVLQRFSNDRIDKETCMKFMSNGFTEVFSVDILTDVLIILGVSEDG